MKQLNSYAVLSPNGNDRITYAFDEIDDVTGEPIRRQVKQSFYVIDQELKAHVDAIRQYITDNKLGE